MHEDRQEGQIGVLLVDRQPLMRAALAVPLATARGITILGAAGDATEALVLVATLAPDVVLLTADRGRGEVLATVARVVGAGRCRVVVLTLPASAPWADETLAAGAASHLPRDAPFAAIERATRDAFAAAATARAPAPAEA